MSDNRVFKVNSPVGYVVDCDESSWNHITEHGHNIMANNVDAVKKAIADPVAVFTSDQWPEKRDVYFGCSSIATYSDDLVTKVIVDIPTEHDENGHVVSCWPQEKISGGITQEGLKYVKPRSR